MLRLLGIICGILVLVTLIFSPGARASAFDALKF